MDLSSGMDLLILWALLGGGGAAVSGAAGKAGEKAPDAAEAGAGEAAAARPAEGAAAGSASVRGEEDAGGGARDDWDALAVGPVASVDEVTAEEWDACARPDEPGSSPFLSHAFLRLLEESGSVARERGWLPTHLVARDKGTGEVQGVAPMYLKGHSRGEYVFDQGWARFYEENGKQYYPKLQCAVPMTPVQGPRLLVREGAPEGTRRELARGMTWLCDQYDASSLHVTFCSQSDAAWLTGDGAGRGGPAQEMLLRTGMQYHWHNENALGEPYASFDEYLAALTQKRRNAVRKEMRQVARAGYTCRRLRGHEITPELWRRFFDFYLDTTERKWGQPYLTMGFFVGLSDALGDSALLVVAEGESGEIVAGALNVVGSDCIYGRNWGCAPGLRVNGLHMQVCYYEAIAAAIELGLARVEAGAQGDHKVARGYLPAPTYSAHYIRAPEFRQPIAKAIAREREDLDEVRRSILSEASPFKAGCEPPRARKLLQDNLS